MANVQSAEKRNRQRLKRRARNQFHLSTMRTYVKKLRAAMEAQDSAKVSEALKAATRIIDKAAQKGAIKRETASRKISRLTVAARKLAA